MLLYSTVERDEPHEAPEAAEPGSFLGWLGPVDRQSHPALPATVVFGYQPDVDPGGALLLWASHSRRHAR